jgi:uncharacterized 2Fe-2S/4Fe-4S cluster protein (DUF4445 family)
MTAAKKVLILFSPSGKRGRFPAGTTVLQAARALGVDIDSICGGRARCARCQVEPVDGTFPREGMVSSPAHLGELTETEISCMNGGQLEPGNRLSCQARILADIRVDVPAGSQLHQQVVRKAYEAHPIELDPVIRLYFTEVPGPGDGQADGDEQRMLQALEKDFGLTALTPDLEVLQSLQAALREENGQVTVAVRNGEHVVAIWAGFTDKVYGAAVDVGSTTIAVQLCDLSSGEVLASAGAMNPQIRYGEDLMSRVSYAMQNAGGAARMTLAVRSAIDELLKSVITGAGIDSAHLLELTLVGNPVMHHLLLGLDPAPLGSSPFALATDHAVETTAVKLGFKLAAGARVYLLPCIAGHIGADTAGLLLAERPWDLDEVSLLIDVGTNAELVLGNSERLLAASSPTGPAFEGAQVSAGQRAAPGAIERVRIDPRTLEPRFKVIGGELWSDDPGFKSQPGARNVTGICGSGIVEAVAGMYLAGIIRPDGAIDGNLANRSTRIEANGRTWSYLLHAGKPDIRILQSDVRAIQLAKAALYAGARLLMDRLGVEKPDRIRLAGAFGSFIDASYAMALGMIPDCEPARVSSAGNAAGTGARIALLSKAARREIETRVKSVERIETATEKDFQQYFVDAMAIPHARDAFVNLSRVMTLPSVSDNGAGRKGHSSN